MSKMLYSLLLIAFLSGFQELTAVDWRKYCPEVICGKYEEHLYLHTKEADSNCSFCQKDKLRKPPVEDDATQPFYIIKKSTGDGYLIVARGHYKDARDCPDELVALFAAKAKELAQKDGNKDYWFQINNGKGVGQSEAHLHAHVGYDMNPNRAMKNHMATCPTRQQTK